MNIHNNLLNAAVYKLHILFMGNLWKINMSSFDLCSTIPKTFGPIFQLSTSMHNNHEKQAAAEYDIIMNISYFIICITP